MIRKSVHRVFCTLIVNLTFTLQWKIRITHLKIIILKIWQIQAFLFINVFLYRVFLKYTVSKNMHVFLICSNLSWLKAILYMIEKVSPSHSCNIRYCFLIWSTYLFFRIRDWYHIRIWILFDVTFETVVLTLNTFLLNSDTSIMTLRCYLFLWKVWHGLLYKIRTFFNIHF